MALTATIHRIEANLSDVDRGAYATLDLRLARHPSESMRYLLTRTLAFCLEHEEGIAFSKGGLSDADEPPISVRTLDGRLVAWIDVGMPSADRLHKAAKAAERVVVYTYQDVAFLRDDAAKKGVFKGEQIDVHRVDPAFLDELEPLVGKSTKMDVLRTEGTVYVTIAGTTFSTALSSSKLLGP